jgi:cytochrome c biogenesis protein CcmG, thiol:disulfide interchange protein DsbE
LSAETWGFLKTIRARGEISLKFVAFLGEIRGSDMHVILSSAAKKWRLRFLLVILCPVALTTPRSSAGDPWLLRDQQAQQEQAQQAVIRLIRDPDPSPEFAVRDMDGRLVSLAAARGKVVLLNFWATWCGPCRMEVPDLVTLQTKYGDRLQVIGLVVDDEDEAAVRAFAKRYAINYPIAMATSEMRFRFGGVPALPTSFIIDAQGRVVQKHIGLRDPVLYETEIRALLGLPINARVETFEDTGEVFLSHANRASELPGVDMTSLTPTQKTVALHRMNEETCTCGCKYTLAQCRIYDSACHVSKERTEKIVAEGANGATPTPAPKQGGPAPVARPNAPTHP